MPTADRRTVLQLLASAPLLGYVDRALAAPHVPGVTGDHLATRRLVLIELKGGNDGLNTVIPVGDPAYRALRPRLALTSNTVALGHGMAMHPNLGPLARLWRAGELAWVLGLGYDNPNRSHFKSGDKWCAGDPDARALEKGWLTRALRGKSLPASPADGLLFGAAHGGPFTGGKGLVLRGDRRAVDHFIASARRQRVSSAASSNPGLRHVLALERELAVAAHRLERAGSLRSRARGFANDALGRQLAAACDLLLAGVPIPVLQVIHNGYDTHARQLPRHANLMKQLGHGIATLRDNLTRAGMWDRTLVVTWSEFGRRAAENGSAGTDHGTAAPHLVTGGKVRGGLYGQQPSLTHLDRGDLRHTMDFRRLYASILGDWWGLDPGSVVPGHKPLALVT